MASYDHDRYARELLEVQERAELTRVLGRHATERRKVAQEELDPLIRKAVRASERPANHLRLILLKARKELARNKKSIADLEKAIRDLDKH